MKRTTIFLEEKVIADLKRAASRRGMSFSMVVREAMVNYLAAPKRAPGLPSLTGRFASEISDTASRVDELLWPDPHE